MSKYKNPFAVWTPSGDKCNRHPRCNDYLDYNGTSMHQLPRFLIVQISERGVMSYSLSSLLC